jgi:hypothetical protein
LDFGKRLRLFWAERQNLDPDYIVGVVDIYIQLSLGIRLRVGDWQIAKAKVKSFVAPLNLLRLS